QGQVHALESKVSFTYAPDVPFNETLAQMAALREPSIVLFLTMTLDGGGLPRRLPEVVESWRRETQVPIYGGSSTVLGQGITGGVMVDLERHSRDLGERARQLLAGARVADV